MRVHGIVVAPPLFDDSSSLSKRIEHAILPPIMSAVLDKVVGPGMIGPFRSQAEAGSVCEPKPSTFGLRSVNFIRNGY